MQLGVNMRHINRFRLWGINPSWALSLISAFSLLLRPGQAMLAEQAPRTEISLKASTTCSVPELPQLISQLILDLPSYSNRVIQRASRLGDELPLYIVVAGQAQITPVALVEAAAAPTRSRLPAPGTAHRPDEEIYQVQFTTLERQYLPTPNSPVEAERLLARAIEPFQQFHQLVLARRRSPADSPWQIISLRSQLVPYPAENRLLAPARDRRKAAIGQGISIWLRDWHSGTLRSNRLPAVPSEMDDAPAIAPAVAPLCQPFEQGAAD